MASLTPDQVKNLRSLCKRGSKVEYAFQSTQKHNIKDFETYHNASNQVCGSSEVSYDYPDNEFVIAEIGTRFDSFGPTPDSGRSIIVEELLKGVFSKLIVDGLVIIDNDIVNL